MNVIVERGAADDLTALAEAWASDETFVFLPAHHRFDAASLARTLSTVPAQTRRDHFALLTSGSTGEPRLVFGAKVRAERLVREIHLAQGLEDVASTVMVLPLSYSYAFVNQWLWAHVMERRAVRTRGFGETDKVSAALSESASSMLCLTGAQARLVVERLAGQTFPSVVRVNLAGSAISYTRWDAFTRLFPRAEVFCNFGCTEAMPRLTVKRAEPGGDPANVGTPLPGIDMRVGDAGALEFRSAYGAVGIVENAAWRALQEWTPTGDLARTETDGTFVLLGRANAVFKRWGEKVSLSALARSVESVWSGDVALYRETDARGEPGCVLVLAPTPDAAQLGAIQQVLRKLHARAEWPLRIESISALPRTTNGKIDSVALPHVDGRQVHWSQRL